MSISVDYERVLLEKAKKGDTDAQEKLMSYFEQYIKTQSFHRNLPSNEIEDNAQNVRLDFLEAIESFDFSRGTRFFTHLYNKVFQGHGKRVNDLRANKRCIILQKMFSLDNVVPTAESSDGVDSILSDFIIDETGEEEFNVVTVIASLRKLNRTEKSIIQLRRIMRK